MKLSQFLIEKKIKFVDGKIEVIDKKLEGEVIFYELNKERIELINNEVVQKLKNDDTDESASYKIFSYLVNIENDVDLQTFVKMINVPPCNEFAVVVDEFIKSYNNLFDKAQTFDSIKKNTDELNKKIPKKEETDEEKIVRLTKDMNEKKDLKKKRIIFKELSELYAKIGE